MPKGFWEAREVRGLAREGETAVNVIKMMIYISNCERINNFFKEIKVYLIMCIDTCKRRDLSHHGAKAWSPGV